MNKLKKIIAEWIFKIRLKKAIRKADKLALKTGKKQLVLIMEMKPVVLSMQQIKTLIRQKYFPKGVDANYICKKAVYMSMKSQKK